MVLEEGEGVVQEQWASLDLTRVVLEHVIPRDRLNRSLPVCLRYSLPSRFRGSQGHTRCLIEHMDRHWSVTRWPDISANTVARNIGVWSRKCDASFWFDVSYWRSHWDSIGCWNTWRTHVFDNSSASCLQHQLQSSCRQSQLPNVLRLNRNLKSSRS